jgi:hypothetical protein
MANNKEKKVYGKEDIEVLYPITNPRKDFPNIEISREELKQLQREREVKIEDASETAKKGEFLDIPSNTPEYYTNPRKEYQ